MRAVLSLLTTLAVASPTTAQEARYTLTGVVVDGATLRPVSSAAVLVAELGQVQVTAEGGEFRLEDLPPGVHVLTVRRAGYVARNFRFAFTPDGGDSSSTGPIPLRKGKEPTTRVTGGVTSALGGAVERAAVVLDGQVVAVSDTGGRFEVGQVEHGLHVLMVRRIGFRPHAAKLELVGPEPEFALEVSLEPRPVQLTEIVVDADHTVYVAGPLGGFYERLQRGTGYYVTGWQIEESSPLRVSDLLRRIPGVRVSPGPFGGNDVRFTRGHCSAPRVYIDDIPMFDARIDDVVFPHDVQGIEVYTGLSTAPAQYARRSSCGVILIWTR